MVTLKLQNAQLEVLSVDNGGYCNQSELTIFCVDRRFSVPDPWDFNEIDLSGMTGWELGIPSGTLTAVQGEVEFKPAEEYTLVVFTAKEARWRGKQAGFTGGMSGYGSFSGTIAAVVEGTFLLPSEPEVSWELYRRRHRRVAALLGSFGCHNAAAEIAEGRASKSEMDEWFNRVKWAGDLPEEEFDREMRKTILERASFSDIAPLGIAQTLLAREGIPLDAVKVNDYNELCVFFGNELLAHPDTNEDMCLWMWQYAATNDTYPTYYIEDDDALIEQLKDDRKQKRRRKDEEEDADYNEYDDGLGLDAEFTEE